MNARKVYIAGPMSGIAGNNYPAFDELAAELRGLGFIVVSPAEMSRVQGFDGSRPLEPHEYAGAMKTDIQAILSVEGIVCMPGWRKSKGARYEVHMAQLLGLETIEWPTGNKCPEICTQCPE